MTPKKLRAGSAKTKPTRDVKARPAAKAAPKRKPVTKRAESANEAPDRWNLRLYVAGQTPRSLTAFSNNGYQWFQVAEVGYDNFMARHAQG